MNNSNDELYSVRHNSIDEDLIKCQMMDPLGRLKPKADFSAIESQIVLPPLVKLEPEINPLKKPGKQITEGTMISNGLKKNIIELRQLLLQEFERFDSPQDFKFYFLQSKFPLPPPGQSNNISYDNIPVIENENTFRDKLSPQQLAQIRENGEFSVKSTRECVKIPYIWKMNETLFKGVKKIQIDWNRHLCAVVDTFEATWEMLTEDMPKELAKIGKFPWRIITLIFGKKQMRVTHSINFENQIAKDFWNEVMAKHYVISRKWSSDLWNFLDIQFKAIVCEDAFFNGNLEELKKSKLEKARQQTAYNERKKKSTQRMDLLNSISNRFGEHWKGVEKKVFTQISNNFQVKLSSQKLISQRHLAEPDRTAAADAQILEKFHEEEFSYYLNFVKKQCSSNNNIPTNVVQAILTILILMHVAKKKQRRWEINYERQKSRLQKEIKEQNPIRSWNYKWFSRKIDSEFKLTEQQLKQDFYKGFIDQELRSKLDPKQVQVFNLWVQFVRSYDTRHDRKQQQMQNLYEPQKSFTLMQMRLPPFEVTRHNPAPDSSATPYFTMEKQRAFEVTTASCGWKLKLYCMKLKVWSVNAFVTLIYLCLKSTFGLRCLCGIDDFTYDQSVDYWTGQVNNETRKTVLGHFMKVLDGIRNSRSSFENQPDTGIFGKNCSRLCNLLQCYIFRFLIVGVIFILALYPIAIILISVISFLLLITIWAWMPIFIILSYFFSIFIYDVQDVKYEDCINNLFPLLALIFRFVFSIVKFLFYLTSFFVFMPIASVFIVIYACICRCMRSMTDKIILCFLGCCGRVPSTNSMFAQKISGPGMARELFMSINEEDVYYLIQAKLEEIYLQQVEKLTRERIRVPGIKFKNTMKLIVEPLIRCGNESDGSSLDNSLFGSIGGHPIQKSISKVQKIFSQKANDFRRRYPKYPNNVRFTDEELNLYFENTQSIVSSYVNKNRLDRWIFIALDVPQNDFAELTKKIWIQTFQSGQSIFEPIQLIEERLKFQDQYSSSNGKSYSSLRMDVGKVVNAIKGQSDLRGKKVAVFSPLNNSLFSNKYQIVKLPEILNMSRLNWDNNVCFNKSSPLFIFYPHLSIKQLTKWEEAKYAKIRGQNRRKMENW